MGTNLQSPGKLAMQRRTPVQAPEIDLAKTSPAAIASPLVSKQRLPKKCSGDNEWRYQEYLVCMLDFVSFCCLNVND